MNNGGMNAESASAPARELVHRRKYEFSGYVRADGLYEIEGRMTDRKTYAFPNDWRGEIAAEEPLHDMRALLVIDGDFQIVSAKVETAAGPFEICPAITPAFSALKGARIGRGWGALLKQKFGGAQGCTHHVELLRNLATVAFQTVYGEQQRRKRKGHAGSENAPAPQENPERAVKRPAFVAACHALAGGETGTK
jgi:hypothetical protein